MNHRHSTDRCRSAAWPLGGYGRRHALHWLALPLIVFGLVSGCAKGAEAAARPPVECGHHGRPRDTPVSYEYVGQTQSSHQVQIRARVNGFLDKRVYTEGTMVKAGDVMFLQDPKPFQAQLAAAKALSASRRHVCRRQRQHRAGEARSALNRLEPEGARRRHGQQQGAACTRA